MVKTATNNTNIYLSVFPYLPDNMHNGEDCDYIESFGATPEMPPRNVERLKEISGYLILQPKQFLDESVWKNMKNNANVPDSDALFV